MNEPHEAQKTQAEELLRDALEAYFKRQGKEISAVLRAAREGAGIEELVQAIITALGPLEAEAVADVLRVLNSAAGGGAGLFTEMAGLEIDGAAINTEAAEWARQYTYDLVRGINETTRQAIRQAVTAFVETPGMTVGDVIASLPLSQARATSIAVTEITRAYAEGQALAGARMAAAWPGVKVRKRWFTNNDDRVCPVCGPLNNKEVDREAKFESGGQALAGPPAHPGCRCWIDYRTRING